MSDDPFDDIPMLPEPLLTEEGFENPNFMPALSAAIANMPETYDRLADDPEWNTPRWTFYREIVGALAQWAIRNISDDGRDDDLNVIPLDSPPFPPDLEKVLGYVSACLKKQFMELNTCDPLVGMAEVSLCDINRMLHEILTIEEFAPFMAWNTKETMGEVWLDLSALLHNTCLTIRNERRDHDRFNKEFEESWAKSPHNPENCRAETDQDNV